MCPTNDCVCNNAGGAAKIELNIVLGNTCPCTVAESEIVVKDAATSDPLDQPLIQKVSGHVITNHQLSPNV